MTSNNDPTNYQNFQYSYFCVWVKTFLEENICMDDGFVSRDGVRGCKDRDGYGGKVWQWDKTTEKE